MSSSDTAGWASEPVALLGERQRVGDEHFRLGVRAQLRAFPMGDGQDALLVVNELGDVLAYQNVAGDPQPLPLVHRFENTYRAPGRSSFPAPEHYKYAAALPRPDGGHDLLLCFAQMGKLYVYRREPGDQPLRFGPREEIGTSAGIIDCIDWRGDGRGDLLLGDAGGRLLRLPRREDAIAFDEAAAVPVTQPDGPITGAGPLAPTVVDMLGRGGRDLIVGDGSGQVVLHLDLCAGGEPRYDRGRLLAKVDGPASAAVVRQAGRRWLLVADGGGLLWRWEITTQPARVLRDWAHALPRLPRGWRLTQDGQRTLLTAAPDPVPPRPTRGDRLAVTAFDPPADELILPLPARGWHEIHVTLRQPPDSPWPPHVVLQLTDEADSQVMLGRERHDQPRQELHYRTANLSGQSLRLRQLPAAHHARGAYPLWIESVRLTPVPAPLPQSAPPPLTRAAIFDAFMWVNHVDTSTAAAADDMVAWHRRAGFDLLYYKMGGAAWEYPSSVPGADSIDPVPFEEFSPADREYCSRVKRLWESFDRFGASIEACHRRGMQCFGWIRLQNENEHFHGKYPISRFYAEHTHLGEVDIHGDAVRGKLCLGYPEVRRFYVELTREAMLKGADGILLDTLRHLPKVMYAPPIVERFRREHGLDMRSLPPMDQRVMALQCRVMGEFLGELRAAMHAVKPGAPLHVRLCKPYPLMGVDPAGWARDGLVDLFLIEDRVGSLRPDLASLKAALQGTSAAAAYAFTRAYWGSCHAPITPRRVAEEAAWARSQGAPLMAFYESAEILEYPEFCRAIRRLNDPGEPASRALLV